MEVRRFELLSRGKRTAKQARRVLSDIYRNLSGEELPTVTVREYFTGFVERKRPEVCPATLDYYAVHSRQFLAWLAEKADGDIATLPAGDDPKAPLHPAACAIVLRLKKSGLLSNQFTELLTAAGLRVATAAEEGKARVKYELSFHSLRHTATSLLKTAGIPQSVVMDYIGHDSADVSHGYTHTGREALEKAAAAFPLL